MIIQVKPINMHWGHIAGSVVEAGCCQSHYQIASSEDNDARAPRFVNNHTETNSMKLAQGKRERKIKVRSARWVRRSKIPRGDDLWAEVLKRRRKLSDKEHWHEGCGMFWVEGTKTSTAWRERIFGKLQDICYGWNTGANGRIMRGKKER